jgi:hypothetical protein
LTQDEIKALIKAQSAGWTELHEKHFAGLTDMTLIVLKGHLLVEQLLTALLLHHCHTPAEVGEAGLRFYQKVALVKAIVSPSFPHECWKMVKLINEMQAIHEIRGQFGGGGEPWLRYPHALPNPMP